MTVTLLRGELARPDHRSVRPARVAQTVAVARSLLEEEGPGALTMRRLAEELGIRAPSLYKHFASKAAVESAVIEDILFDIGQATHEALRPSPPTSPLLSLLATYRTFSLAHPNLYRLATGGRWPGRTSPRSGGLGRQPLVRRDRRSLSGPGPLVLRPRHGHPRARRPLPTGLRSRRSWRAGASAFQQAAATP